ncbi:type IV pilus inner membrane component PilO [Natronospora cellulosivora (SeqCode)]
MFNNLSRRERLMLVFLAVFAIAAIYYFLLYEPMLGRIDSLNQELSNKEVTYNMHVATISKMPELEKRYEELRYIEDQIQENMIESVPAMLQVLESQSADSGLEIIAFIPQELDDSTRINMEARGFYEQLVGFIDGIKSLDGFIEFERINIRKENNDNDLLRINGTFVFHNDLLIGGGDS